MWTLTIRSPDGKPRTHSIVDPITRIGRREGNHILIEDPSASRSHAEFQYDKENDTLVLVDLGSMNGTYVNRTRITSPRRLSHNDVIRIGEHLIYVALASASDEEQRLETGTHPLTRDVVLESIDQHAVLLYEIARKLNSVVDIPSALQEVSNMLRVTLGAERCEVILADNLDNLSAQGFPTTFATLALEKRSAILIPEVSANDKRFGNSTYLYKIRSLLCVPIMSSDELLGLIYTYKTDPDEVPFDQKDLQLAVAISHQAALTIQRMYLMEKIKKEQLIRQLLERFVSPTETEYVTKQVSRTGKLPGLEELKVTVLFADISDSTGLAERLGAKRFGKLLASYYKHMTEVIFDYGGMVDKFLGDGIMAVFGMTGEMEDPEGRAVKAGLKMLDVLDRMNQKLEHRIEIGVGINTGMVVAGYVGTLQQVELTVLGDTVNVAAGLQNLARPNRVIIGPATVAAVIGRFATQRVGPVIVKGRTRDIQAHEVLRST